MKVRKFGLTAQAGRKCLQETESTMLFGNRRRHRNRAKHMTKSTDPEQDKETKADAQEGIEEWLDADAVYDVNKKAEP